MRRAVRRTGLLVGSIMLAACAGRAGSVAEREPAIPPLTSAPSTAPATTEPAATDPPATIPPPTDAATTDAATTVPTVTDAPAGTDDVGAEPGGEVDERRPPELGGVDELFPALGSPDVDVLSYDVRLDLTDLGDGDGGDTAVLVGDVAIEAVVPTEVNGLALDAVGLDVVGATVDGDPATVDVEETDLVVSLPAEREETVRAVVEYTVEIDRSRSRADLPVGWFVDGDRAHALNQPDGARTWLPSNDHPSDKAEWRFEVVAPEGAQVSANGELLQPGDAADPWVWQESDPMATYLVHLVVGDLDFIEDTLPTADGDLELTHVVPAGEAQNYTVAMGSVGPQIAFLETVLGPYPLERYGLAFAGLVDGLAMETQGRVLLDENAQVGALGAFDQLVLVHELAHQWYGNAVTPATWSDIWLSESFATYGQWLWFDHEGLQTIDSSAGTALANRRSRGGPATGDPTVAELFGYNVYDGGATVLHALRLTIGDESFFELLQRWVAEHSGSSRTSQDFIDFASTVHGSDLTDFFEEWLYATTVPPEYPR